jgi:SAM-dependent methyltransferase
MSQESEYVLGTDLSELERLGLQHRAWRAQAYEHWERAGLAPGQRILDVGSGPGFATLDLARLAGARGSVTAVDVSKRFLSYLERALAREELANVSLVEQDATRLELEPSSHDAAWTRWLLSFAKDPAAVIAGVAKALVPGGIWAIQEYVSYSSMKLGPEGKRLPRVVAAIVESWRAQGGDSDVGLALPRLLERAGFLVTETRPIARIARPGTALWEWPGSFFENFVPKLAEQGFLAADEAKGFLEEWRAHSDDPEAIFLAPTVVAITAVKAG